MGHHGVGFVSITENLDYSTPHGKLTTQMLGGMAEFFSGMLAKHTKKGIDERARQGMHLGSIPFGYESCWKEENGERTRICDPEHPGGVHVHHTEGPAVMHPFKSYASGTTTLATLASRLGDEGFRTRNTKRLPDAQGELVAEPRLFTTASIRGLLHNPFFTGRVRHKDKLMRANMNPLYPWNSLRQSSTPRRRTRADPKPFRHDLNESISSKASFDVPTALCPCLLRLTKTAIVTIENSLVPVALATVST